MSALPDFSLSLLERVYPRTLLALAPREKARLARELASGEDLARFPERLGTRKWESGRGFAPDLATLEYSLRLVGMAPELESRGFDRIMLAAEPDWYAARFRFDPGHRLLESEWPLHEAFAEPQTTRARRYNTYLIYRSAGRSQFRALGANEEALLRPLSLGVPLGRVLERHGGPDFDAPLFQRWIESGLLRAIDWAAV